MSSFEPKNEQQYYCISALPDKNSQIKKKRMQIAILEDK